MHERGANFMRRLVRHSALRLDQPFDLVKHIVGIGRQFRKFVAVPRTRHARFDMTGTDRGEGGVHGLHPIA